jgi:hypothetical protein
VGAPAIVADAQHFDLVRAAVDGFLESNWSHGSHVPKRAMILVTRPQRASEASYESCTAVGRPGQFVPFVVEKKMTPTERAQPIHVSSTVFPQASVA